ncbi:MAG: hypothetical protein WAS49_06320, partial [Candidatus Dechloromonas phosphoritropha]
PSSAPVASGPDNRLAGRAFRGDQEFPAQNPRLTQTVIGEKHSETPILLKLLDSGEETHQTITELGRRLEQLNRDSEHQCDEVLNPAHNGLHESRQYRLYWRCGKAVY